MFFYHWGYMASVFFFDPLLAGNSNRIHNQYFDVVSRLTIEAIT